MPVSDEACAARESYKNGGGGFHIGIGWVRRRSGTIYKIFTEYLQTTLR